MKLVIGSEQILAEGQDRYCIELANARACKIFKTVQICQCVYCCSSSCVYRAFDRAWGMCLAFKLHYY